MYLNNIKQCPKFINDVKDFMENDFYMFTKYKKMGHLLDPEKNKENCN